MAIYRKDVSEKSPMRVFERSIHGGLGRGNVGAVVSRAGIGKTALLVQLALDDLMRDRKVLHIAHESPVDRVRAYYDEIFHELALVLGLQQPEAARLDIERNRLIFSLLDTTPKAPPSQPTPLSGPPSSRGSVSVAKVAETVRFARDVAQFVPQTIVIDGFDFDVATSDTLAAIGALARESGAEVWLSAKSGAHAPVNGPPSASEARASTPEPLRRFYDHLQVILLLQSDGDEVRLQIIKDHDNPDLSDLHLALDPKTMRVVDESIVVARATGPRDPGSFHLYSGGAQGAEATFGASAERWGCQETHFSFDGHPFVARERGRVILGDEELGKGDFSLVYASHRLKRPLSQIPNIKRILQTVWHQITQAEEVFVIGSLQDDGTVRGGTGWGAELARLWNKPTCVFDQEKGAWFRWDMTRWEREERPTIQRTSFAGIGTTRLTTEGKKAIEQLFARTFGETRS